MLSMVICARLLGKASFGELGIVQSSVVMVASLSALGMGVTATKHIAEFRRNSPEKIGSIVAMTLLVTLFFSGLLSGLLYLFSHEAANTLLVAPHLADALKIGAINIIILSATGATTSILTGFEAYKTLGIINTVSTIFMLPTVSIGCFYMGLYGALWGIVLSGSLSLFLVLMAVCHVMRREKIPLSVHVHGNDWRLLTVFGLPAVIINVVNSAGNWAASVYLVSHASYAEMGVFNAANQWFAILLFIPCVVADTFLPILSDYAGKRDKHTLKKIIKTGLKINLSICIPLAIFVTLASPWIMKLYGSGYENGYPTLILIALAAMASSLQNLLGNFLAATNHMGAQVLCNIIWVIVYVLLTHNLVDAGYQSISLGASALAAYAIKTAITACIVVWLIDYKSSKHVV